MMEVTDFDSQRFGEERFLAVHERHSAGANKGSVGNIVPRSSSSFKGGREPRRAVPCPCDPGMVGAYPVPWWAEGVRSRGKSQ